MSSITPALQPEFSQFSLLCITYVQSSPSSFFLSLSSIFPYLLLYSLLVLILFQRHFQDVLVFAGLLLNELVNQILKRVWREMRPERTVWHRAFAKQSTSAFTGDNHSSTYGMPSSHAQFMAFFFFCAVLYYSNTLVDFKRDFLHGKVIRGALVLVGFGACALVGAGRVHQEYHSFPQIGVGYLVGMVFAFVWRYLLWKPVLRFLENWNNRFLETHYRFRDAELVNNLRELDFVNFETHRDTLRNSHAAPDKKD